VAVLVILNIPREFTISATFMPSSPPVLAWLLMMAAFGLTYFPNMVLSNPLPEKQPHDHERFFVAQDARHHARHRAHRHPHRPHLHGLYLLYFSRENEAYLT